MLLEGISELFDLHILVIDDNPGDIGLIEAYLAELSPSISLKAASNIQDGFMQVTSNKFDVCLLDYEIGTQTGLEFLKIIKDVGINLPVILLTGLEDYLIDVKAMMAGAFDYINKNDLDATLLERSLRYALSHHRTMIALTQSQQSLQKAALYDNLTNLPNRTLFLDRLEHAFNIWKRTQKPCAVLFIDLDGFKPINDTYGHHLGDFALKSIAQRLEERLRQTDTVARLGGDEFTVLLENFDSEESVVSLAKELIAIIQQPMVFESYPSFSLSASIGVAYSHTKILNFNELLRCADIAMYRAKQSVGRGVKVYDASMHEELSYKLRLKQSLKSALENNEFELLYQPIVSIGSGDIYGFEALLRWRKNERLLTPAEFLDIAEVNGDIVSISKWVLEQACTWCANYNQNLQHNRYSLDSSVAVTVNISPKQFKQSDFVASVKRALKLSGLQANCLHLEMTENLVLYDLGQSTLKLNELRALGIRIFLDDFGTGFSSLQHIVQLPVDALKIDRSFIQRLPDQKSEAVIAGLMLIAEKLNLEVVAEGIEDIFQLQYVAQSNCLLGQGYLFSKPLVATACEALVGLSLLPQAQTQMLPN